MSEHAPAREDSSASPESAEVLAVGPPAASSSVITQVQTALPATRHPLPSLLATYAREAAEAPASELAGAGFAWGLAQPLLGLRTLVGRRELLRRAVWPVLAFVALCALFAERGPGAFSWLEAYYLALIGAAPLSPILFARNYARLAAEARPHFGLEPREPFVRPIGQTLGEALRQLILLGIGVAPLAGLIAIVPLIGPIWAGVVGYAWAMHWIVIEAFDSAKTLGPAGEPPEPSAQEDAMGLPWFALPARFRIGPLRRWFEWLARLSRPWRLEVSIVERRPWIAGGFALGAAVLLAMPVLNLFFRPAVVVAAAHVLGRIESTPRA